MQVGSKNQVELAPLLQRNLPDLEIRVDGVGREAFERYPNIKVPGIKRRWLDTSNLKRETGPFLIKGFKYLAQLVRRMRDDVYSGLRHAVNTYNLDKSEKNLDLILKQVELLKKREDFDSNDPTLIQIANQAIANRWENIPFHFRGEGALQLDEQIKGADDLNRAIRLYNRRKIKEKLTAVLEALSEWMRQNPEETLSKCSEIQHLYYQIASAIPDRATYELFASLRTGKTLTARVKIVALEEKMGGDLLGTPRERLNLPQVVLHLSLSKHKSGVVRAIGSYNREKSLESLKTVLDLLRNWHYAENSTFNRSNSLKILATIDDILKGKTKKDLCKKWDSFIFASSIKNQIENYALDWSSFPSLPLSPPPLIPFIEDLNRSSFPQPTKLRRLIQEIEACVEREPDVFIDGAGEKLLNLIQESVLKCAARKSTEKVPLLPSVHPKQTIARNTDFHPEEGENCYIVAFVNPVAPWSHTELVFVKGEKPVTPEFFLVNPHVLDGYFNEQGELIKDIEIDNFPVQYRPYINNIAEMLLKGCGAHVIDQLERRMSLYTFEFFKKEEFLTKEGFLNPGLLCQQSPLWDAIDEFWEFHPDYADFLKATLATPIRREFNERSFIRVRFTEEQSDQICHWMIAKHLTITQMDSTGKTLHFLSRDWPNQLKEEDFPLEWGNFREWILYQMISLGERGDEPHREYLGIGAEGDTLDQYSEGIMGVRVTDQKLVHRMRQIAKRRQKELQKGMNIFGAVKSGLKSMAGEVSKMLLTREEKSRHLRQALIDNFLTELNPNSFRPDEEEPRYRLELYESGGEVYRKWIEDANGQFCMMKTPSSRDSSGDYIEGEYVHNSYVLIDGKLKSIKSLDKEKLRQYEKGNLIFKMDGTLGWENDEEFGQYFKKINEPPERAEKDDRVLYPAKNLERFLSNGETEWCGSYAIRMLHSAYFFHYFPPFAEVFNQLKGDFCTATEYQDESIFEERHAKVLFTLADEYAKRLVTAEAGQKYFQEMSPDIQLTPRLTPDMIHEFLSGKAAGPARALGRALLTLHIPKGRDFNLEGKSMVGLFYAARGATVILGLPTASMKFAYNAIASTTGLAVDLFAIPYRAWQQHSTSKITAMTHALGKRIFFEYIPLHLATDAYNLIDKSQRRSAF